MITRSLVAFGVAVGAMGVWVPEAHAADSVTYELVSDFISTANNIEYVDEAGRQLRENVPLPWRLNVTLTDARGPTARGGAQVRADWRPTAWPGKWVVASIFSNGKLLCQNTLDVGDVVCYGNTHVINGYIDPKK